MEPNHGGEDDHDVDDHQNGHDGHVNQHLCRLLTRMFSRRSDCASRAKKGFTTKTICHSTLITLEWDLALRLVRLNNFKNNCELKPTSH